MSFPTPTIPLYADTDRMYDDIGKSTGNTNRDNLVKRANEDASSYLNSIFKNNVDFDTVQTDEDLFWFVDMATKLAIAEFWKKSNGTQEQKEEVIRLQDEAKKINKERFFPTEYR